MSAPTDEHMDSKIHASSSSSQRVTDPGRVLSPPADKGKGPAFPAIVDKTSSSSTATEQEINVVHVNDSDVHAAGIPDQSSEDSSDNQQGRSGNDNRHRPSPMTTTTTIPIPSKKRFRKIRHHRRRHTSHRLGVGSSNDTSVPFIPPQDAPTPLLTASSVSFSSSSLLTNPQESPLAVRPSAPIAPRPASTSVSVSATFHPGEASSSSGVADGAARASLQGQSSRYVQVFSTALPHDDIGPSPHIKNIQTTTAAATAATTNTSSSLSGRPAAGVAAISVPPPSSLLPQTTAAPSAAQPPILPASSSLLTVPTTTSAPTSPTRPSVVASVLSTVASSLASISLATGSLLSGTSIIHPSRRSATAVNAEQSSTSARTLARQKSHTSSPISTMYRTGHGHTHVHEESFTSEENSEFDDDEEEEEEEDVSASDIDSQEDHASWIEWYCAEVSRNFYCEVDSEFILDEFNLTGLANAVPYYAEALDVILDDETVSDNVSDEEIQASAERLYILIHQRFLMTNNGMKSLATKYDLGVFGVCRRVFCNGQRVIPIGISDLPSAGNKLCLFCPSCADIYRPRSRRQQHLDGAAYGTSVPHHFFLMFPDRKPQIPSPLQTSSSSFSVKSQSSVDKTATAELAKQLGLSGTPPQVYTPRIFGYRLHSSAANAPKARWLREGDYAFLNAPSLTNSASAGDVGRSQARPMSMSSSSSSVTKSGSQENIPVGDSVSVRDKLQGHPSHLRHGGGQHHGSVNADSSATSSMNMTGAAPSNFSSAVSSPSIHRLHISGLQSSHDERNHF